MSDTHALRPPSSPIEPPPTEIVFPDVSLANEDGVLAVGEDFRPGTLLAAYRHGVFPWPHRYGGRHVVLWCTPDPRAHFELPAGSAALHWSRSLRRTLRSGRFTVTTDVAFDQVIRACGRARKGGTWIIPPLIRGYEELFTLGHAHSVEVWDSGQPERLVGGIYGVAVGRAFAGESMFHLETDASKVAFATLATSLRHMGYTWFDVQVMNPHLASLGCVEIPRDAYLAHLRTAAVTPSPAWYLTNA
jgi:leucyl/phenylalanyl-tRNA--protein transferase